MRFEFSTETYEMLAGKEGHRVGKAVGRLLAPIKSIVRTTKGETLKQCPWSSYIVTESLSAGSLIKEQRRIRNADRVVSYSEKRIIQHSRVVEQKISHSELIRQTWTESMK